MLVFLGAFSNPWFRSLGYELFVHTHILGAIAYLGTIFWHAADQKDSWIYLWASVAIWVVQLAARAWDKTAIFEMRRKVRNVTAHISVLDDDSGQAAMMRITIHSPLKWTPGQHVFLRFPRLGMLDNHPFTITSVPKAFDSVKDKPRENNELLFLVRPYNGVTKRLLSRAVEKQQIDAEQASASEGSRDSSPQARIKANDSHSVRLDGPYGGLLQHEGMHRLYDHVILVAGGGGISAMLPWLTDLASHIQNIKEPRRVQKVNLIWCIRHASAKTWVADELRDCLRLAGKSIHVDVYVTGDDPSTRSRDASRQASEMDDSATSPDEISRAIGDSDEKALAAQGRVLSSTSYGERVHTGRPHLLPTLEGLITLRKTLIMGCGPESLKIDLSNAAAMLQSRVLRDEAEEVSLHTETFGW